MPGQVRFPAFLSTTVAALVRRHFAPTQAELGQWLGVSQATIEAGRRQLSARPDARLGRLEAAAPPTSPSPLARAHAALRQRLLLAEAEGLEALTAAARLN